MTGYGSFGESLRTSSSYGTRRSRRTNPEPIEMEMDMDMEVNGQGDQDGRNPNGDPSQERNNNNNNDPNEEEPENGEYSMIRGTNIDVRTAARTFKEFIQNFISVQESERAFEREQKAKMRQAKQRAKALKRAGAGGDGDGGGGGDPMDSDDDDDSFESINTYDSTDEKRYAYLDHIRDILFGRNRRNGNHNNDEHDNDAMTSAAAVATTAPFDLNARHLYFHSPACQRLYHQLISYPAEVVPLMDLIVEREMESMRVQLYEEMEERAEEEGGETEIPLEYATLLDRNAPLPKVQVRPYNLKALSHMRSLDPNSIDNLLSIRGMVVRTSPVIPDLKVADRKSVV